MTTGPNIGLNEPCWCGSGQKFKRCHRRAGQPLRPGTVGPLRGVPEGITRPPYVDASTPDPMGGASDRRERMARTGRLAADVLAAVAAAAQPGLTTDELDALGHDLIVAAGAYPSPLGYGPPDNLFPKSICTSVNEAICHGIPDDRALRDGDIVSIDVSAYREGVHGDTCATVAVGHVDPQSAALIAVTRDCLARAIDAVRPGAPLNVIGRAIQEHAEGHGFAVVRDFVGHGVGEEFHTKPQVPHYYDPALTTPMEPGTTFTIEPMIATGSWQVRMWDDGWTAVTADRSRVAQFEHTLVVTDDGAEVLTVPADPSGHPYWG